YLAAPGYAEMFAAAGFGELVAFARERPSPKELAERVPDELVDAVALVGDGASVRARIDAYHGAGVREIGLVVPPVDTAVGRRTIEALAPAPHP
ncbi:MAG: LLM class F420-dependent oxidoreductase, partial [Actinomycetota bacterium]|nr:LLM class F420-dependent oxidoreductase [Actinomycetota bacterium]